MALQQLSLQEGERVFVISVAHRDGQGHPPSVYVLRENKIIFIIRGIFFHYNKQNFSLVCKGIFNITGLTWDQYIADKIVTREEAKYGEYNLSYTNE